MKNAIRTLYLASLITGLCCANAKAVPAESNQYSLGVEGFYDNYQEPVATVDSSAEYGSITGDYSHNWNAFFAALDGRASYGFDNYQSDTGTADRIPQWEFEGRIRAGYTFKNFSPYVGVGTRYYWDEFKGVTTLVGGQAFSGYDRRITQVYIPVGFTFNSKISDGFYVSPNLEYDQLVWGQVSSRLGTIPGLNNTINNQHQGWGVRGSVMFGWGGEPGNLSWQAGPFLRYWNIADSNVSDFGSGEEGLEPHNTRLQAGLAIRALW